MSQNAIDRQTIIHTLTKYAWGFDENDFSLLASVFAEDAASGGRVADTDVAWGPMRGRAEIVSGLQRMRNSQTDRRRHCLSNFHFVRHDDVFANVRCYMTLLSADAGKVASVTMGIFDVDLKKGNEQAWLITRLEITLDAPF